MARLFYKSRRTELYILTRWTLAFLMIGAVAVSCTSKSESARFRIEIPRTLPAVSSEGESLKTLSAMAEDEVESLKTFQLGSQSSFTPGVIVVNVRYTPTGPVRHQFQWQNPCMTDDEKPCAAGFPNPIAMDVESGSQRLVQVMVIYFNETRQMRFLYGDLTKDLSPGPNEVTINAKVFGDPAGSGETIIAGRYVSTVNQTYPDGVGPTGSMTMMFQPPNGRPMRDILKSEIFNGYFNVMAIDGVPTVYRLDSTGEVILKDLAPAQLSAKLGQKLLKVHVPAVFYRNFNSDEPEFEPYEGSDLYLGFFGPGVASLSNPTVCYPSEDNLDITYTYKSESTSDPLRWFGSTFNDEHVSRSGGGVAIGTGACEGSVTTAKKFFFDPMQIANGKDSLFDVRGAFLRVEHEFDSWGEHCSHKDYALGCFDEAPGEMEYRWAYAPGIFAGPGAISGVTLFTKVVPQDLDSDILRYNGMRDGYRCGEFASMGFQGVHFTAVENTSYRHAIDPQPDTQIFAVLCPYKLVDGQRTYFDSGVRIHSLEFGGQSGDGGNPFVEPPITYIAYDMFSALPSGFSFSRPSEAFLRESPGTIYSVFNDEPRIEYRYPSTESLGLLIEPAATNEILESVSLDNGSFWIQTEVTVSTAFSDFDPTGADGSVRRITDSGTEENGFDYLKYDMSGLLDTGIDYTFSVYLKKDTSTSAVIWLNEAGYQGPTVEIDLNTGAIQPTTYGSSPHYGVEPRSNGWFRVWVALTKDAGTNFEARILPQYSNGYDQPRDDTLSGGSVLAWGAQLETGIGPTSYIPTSGGLEYRMADLLSGTVGPAYFDLQYGTIIVEFETPYSRGGQEQVVMSLIRSDDPNEYLSLTYFDEEPGLTRAKFVINSTAHSINSDSHLGDYLTANTIQRMAISFDNSTGDLIFSNAGHQVEISLPLPYPDYDKFEIGHRNGMGQMTGWIRKVIHHPEPLTAPELNSVTNPNSPYFDGY